jgi:hypothetical protein
VRGGRFKRAFALVLASLVLVAAGCSHAFDAEAQLAGSVADVAKCSSSLSAKSARPLPHGLPVPRRTHAYQYVVQGRTQFWFTTVPGSSSTLVDTRDRIKQGLTRAGFVKTAQDQELGAEADYYFAGPYLGSAQVRPLCHGRLRVRYGFGAASLGPLPGSNQGSAGRVQPPGRGVSPTTAPVPTTTPSCVAIPPPLPEPPTWVPSALSLPAGSYASRDLSPSSGGVHAGEFVVPSTVTQLPAYVRGLWPSQGVTITAAEQDPTDAELAFVLDGHQGSMQIAEGYCVPGYVSVVLAYDGP